MGSELRDLLVEAIEEAEEEMVTGADHYDETVISVKDLRRILKKVGRDG